MTTKFKPEGYILINSIRQNNDRLKQLSTILSKTSMPESLAHIMTSISRKEILDYIQANFESRKRRRGVSNKVKPFSISVLATTAYQLKDIQAYIRAEHLYISLALLVSCLIDIYCINNKITLIVD